MRQWLGKWGNLVGTALMLTGMISMGIDNAALREMNREAVRVMQGWVDAWEDLYQQHLALQELAAKQAEDLASCTERQGTLPPVPTKQGL